MTKLILLLGCLVCAFICSAQDQNTKFDRYKLHKKWKSQESAYYKIKKKDVKLNKGWSITEKKGDLTIERVLTKDTIITVKQDTPIKLLSNWKVSEVKYEDKDPGKLYLNPHTFRSDSDSLLNNKCYIKIPENSFAVITRRFIKWQPITIPFSIRPAISGIDTSGMNIEIGSKVTTELKIGSSLSYNYNFEFFRNRRIKAKKSVIGLSGGVGFGFSRVVLNKSSTSLADSIIENEEDGLALFVAPGFGINLKGFQIAIFLGWDIGLTDNVDNWNYNMERYWGIGLGSDLSVFGKQ